MTPNEWPWRVDSRPRPQSYLPSNDPAEPGAASLSPWMNHIACVIPVSIPTERRARIPMAPSVGHHHIVFSVESAHLKSSRMPSGAHGGFIRAKSNGFYAGQVASGREFWVVNSPPPTSTGGSAKLFEGYTQNNNARISPMSRACTGKRWPARSRNSRALQTPTSRRSIRK